MYQCQKEGGRTKWLDVEAVWIEVHVVNGIYHTISTMNHLGQGDETPACSDLIADVGCLLWMNVILYMQTLRNKKGILYLMTYQEKRQGVWYYYCYNIYY